MFLSSEDIVEIVAENADQYHFDDENGGEMFARNSALGGGR